MPTAPFSWEDPFFLDEQLTQEERMIRDSTRQFAESNLMSRGAGSKSQRTLSPRNYE